MEFGRFSFARSRSLLVSAALLAGLAVYASAQQGQSPSSSTVPELPAAVPVSQAAIPSTPVKTDPAKPAQNGMGPVSDSSLVRLGAGDLLEVSVYGVPELSTKARVGNSGDVYLPLIDYVHVGDLTVEE